MTVPTGFGTPGHRHLENMDSDELLARLFGQGDMAWQMDANCRGLDPNLFFPERGGEYREAVAVCAECRVREECLEWALEHHEIHGIWGGLPERQRRLLRRQRKQETAA